jgi:hypothetical protein
VRVKGGKMGRVAWEVTLVLGRGFERYEAVEARG